MEQQVVTILGGTGFVGRYIVKLLAKAGYTIRVISRRPEAALHLKTAGTPGQIVLIGGNLADAASLAGKLDYSHAVINLIGVLFESGKQNFASLHAQGAEKLAQLAKASNVHRLIHVSALGVDKVATSHYARSKLLGEKAVLASFPQATILRPSVIFGPEDHFFNQFAAMACFSPVLPLIGGGHTRFQTVYVGDVAKATQACLTRDDALGRIYELGGPQIFTFKEILQYILRIIDRKRMLLPIPFGLASLIGTMGEFLPTPPLTRDQVKLLHYDNVVSANAPNFSDLAIEPTAVEMIVPEYLARFRKKAAAC